MHKTVHHRQDGYKGHVAVEPDTGLFTAAKLTQASGEDNHEAVIGLELLNDEDGELEVLGDSAYGTGDARAALADNKTPQSSNLHRCGPRSATGSPSTTSP